MNFQSLQNLTGSDALGYLKTISTKVKQMALNLTDLEVKVEEATNNEPWGPHGTVMAEISEAAYDSENYKQIMGVVARRLQDQGEDWRHVYKSLLLLEYMLKHGPQKVVQELASNVVVIEKLGNFQYKDKNGKDFGENVRHRAKELANLVMDTERIREERHKAKELKSKYTGLSSDSMRSSGRASGGSGRRVHYEDEDYDAPPRSSKSSGSRSQAQDYDDPVIATRARIEAIKQREPLPAEEEGSSPTAAKPGKKLSTTRVDPKIAASLGVKFAPAAPAAAPAAAKPAPAANLLGGLDDPPAASTTQASSSDWTAFDSGTNGSAAPDDIWAAFTAERASAGTSAAPSNPAEDLLGALGGGGLSGAGAQTNHLASPLAGLEGVSYAPTPAAPPAAAAVSDPFAALSAPPAPAAGDPFSTHSTSPGGPPATSPKAKLTALPEDIFSEGLAPPKPAYGAPQPGFQQATGFMPGGLPASSYGQQPGMAPQPGYGQQMGFATQMAFPQSQQAYGMPQPMPGYGQMPGFPQQAGFSQGMSPTAGFQAGFQQAQAGAQFPSLGLTKGNSQNLAERTTYTPAPAGKDPFADLF